MFENIFKISGSLEILANLLRVLQQRRVSHGESQGKGILFVNYFFKKL